MLVALTLVMPPSAQSESPQGAVDGDWLIRQLAAEPATLNPVTATDVYSGYINGYIYESLLDLDNRTLNLVPMLTDTYEISPDRLSYLFTLREDVRWQDGRPLTAEDVVFTFNVVMDPKVDAPHLRSYVKNLRKVEALDTKRVRFTFSEPYFKSLEIIGGIGIIPRHIFSKGDFNTHPAGRKPTGSGPYRFLRWDTGREIILERNPDYWGKKPHLKRIVFRIITDSTAALQVLKKGEMDLMNLTPVQWVKQSESRKFRRIFERHRYYLPGYSFVGWNHSRPFFSDSRVRRAMTMMLDRKSILENVLYSFGQVVSGTFFYESPFYDRTIEPWPFDPAAAAVLLDEAGWTDSDGDGLRDRNGIPFRFELILSPGSQIREQIATVLQEELSRSGIEMTIRPLDWSLLSRMIDDRDFDAVIMGWSLPVEADPYQVWHSSQIDKGSNFIGFKNLEADRIIEEARVTFDKNKRIQLYRRFHRITHEEQPYTFLFISESLVAIDRRFENVNVYPLGLNTNEWWVKEARQKYK